MQEVKTKATGPGSNFSKELALKTTAVEDEAYRVANMTADKRLQFQLHIHDAETEALTWSVADTERVTIQLEREIYGITSNEQKRFKTEFSIRLIEFEPWWETFVIQALQTAIEQCVIYFGYPMMHLVSHISKSIRRMGSSDNVTTDISERQHISNVKEAYRSSNKVNYIRQMLKHNDLCTSLDYMEETLSYLALEVLYNIDSANVFNLLSTTDKQGSTRRAHLLRLRTILDERIIRPVSQQVYPLSEPHVHGVCRSFKLTTLRDVSQDFGIPNFGQVFHAQIEEDWGCEVNGIVLRHDQNVLSDSILIKHQNGLLYDRQPFHNPTSVERLGLDCKVVYTNANQGIMPGAHNIWVQYMQSEEYDLDNTFQGQIPCFPVLYFSWTPPNYIRQFQDHLPAGKAISTVSERCKIPQQCVLRPQAQEYAVVIPTKYKDLHGSADCVDGFIRVVKQTNKIHIVPDRAIVGPALLVQKNAALGGMDIVWLVNNYVDLDTYRTVY